MNILEARRRMLGADVYKKTVQGNPVSVRSLARMRPGLKVFGRSAQDTTTGAQLIPFELGAEMTSINGATKCIPKKDGFRIELNGTSNQTAEFDIRFVGGYNYLEEDSYDECENLPAGTYYAKISDNRFTLNVIAWRGTNITLISTSTGGSFEVQDGDKFRIFIRPTASAVDATVKAIISKQNDSVMYEPYTGGKPSPSTDYPQEITSVGDDGEIEVTVGSDGYVEKGTAFEAIKKIPLLKGSYVYLKSNIGTNKMNTFVVDDPNLIETIGRNNSNVLYSYCTTQLGISSILPNGSTISGNARLSASWGNGVQYKIEQDGLYLYYANNNRVNDDAENTFVWFLDHEGSKERPYTSQSLTVQTPNGLPGIPVTSGGNYTDESGQQWICDEVDFKRGKYVQKIILITLTGSNLQAAFPSEQYGTYVNTDRGKLLRYDSQKLVMSDQYIGVAFDDRTTLVDGFRAYLDSTGRLVIRLPVGDNRSLEEIKVAVDEQKPQFLCALATPIETDLTEEQMAAYANLHTNRPTTVVSATDGAGLELTYKTKKSLEVN